MDTLTAGDPFGVLDPDGRGSFDPGELRLPPG
jgi:hypothetical protein